MLWAGTAHAPVVMPSCPQRLPIRGKSGKSQHSMRGDSGRTLDGRVDVLFCGNNGPREGSAMSQESGDRRGKGAPRAVRPDIPHSGGPQKHFALTVAENVNRLLRISKMSTLCQHG